VNRSYLPETVAHVRITQQSISMGKIEGEVKAAQYGNLDGVFVTDSYQCNLPLVEP
jgi:hypothetical protein